MSVQPGRPAEIEDVCVAFGRTLRAAGVGVTTDRLTAFVDALARLDAQDRRDVYWAGRATLVADPADVPRYDRAFDAFFSGEAPHRRLRAGAPPGAPPPARSLSAPIYDTSSLGEAEDEEQVTVQVGASSADLLRTRDLATLSPADREVVNRLLAALSLPGEPRRTRRHQRWHHGGLDRRRTVREALHGLGDPKLLRRRRHARRPRTVVLLVDVSGSMSAYADALLRFAHVAVGRAGGTGGGAWQGRGRGRRRVEAFTLGTRLTRITAELSQRDPDSAMAAVAGAIPDWSGGTRLGAGLKRWLDGWGQRGMARGAIVVIMSDGWERGDAALLAAQMARLQRLAHRVIWSNPRKAAPGFAPVTAGMAAALPHVDVFLSGHSVAALEALAAAVAGRGSGPGGGPSDRRHGRRPGRTVKQTPRDEHA